MQRSTFLTFTAVIPLAVSAFAVLAPAALLESKGVMPSPATIVWVREVGVLLFALGTMNFVVRHEPSSRAMVGILIGNALVQVGLCPIEAIAYAEGVLGELGGVVPNTLLHVVLAIAFTRYAWLARASDQPSASARHQPS